MIRGGTSVELRTILAYTASGCCTFRSRCNVLKFIVPAVCFVSHLSYFSPTLVVLNHKEKYFCVCMFTNKALPHHARVNVILILTMTFMVHLFGVCSSENTLLVIFITMGSRELCLDFFILMIYFKRGNFHVGVIFAILHIMAKIFPHGNYNMTQI